MIRAATAGRPPNSCSTLRNRDQVETHSVTARKIAVRNGLRTKTQPTASTRSNTRPSAFSTYDASGEPDPGFS